MPLNPPNKGSGKAPLRGDEEVDLARKMQVRVAYIRVKYLAREALGRDPTHREWADVLGISDKALAEALTAAADAKTTMIRSNSCATWLAVEQPSRPPVASPTWSRPSP